MKNSDGLKDLLELALKQKQVVTDTNIRLFEPVSPREFLTSQYFTGFGTDNLYDFWLQEAEDFITGGFNELIITGSLGSGKTTVVNMIYQYKLYELFSWTSINGYLALPEIQDVYNIYFSISRTQAKLTGFKQLTSLIDNSKWFATHSPRDSKIDSILKFNNGKFGIFSGSNHSHAIGMTIWSFILDEADFFNQGQGTFDTSYERITEMYQELIDRRASRFMKFGQDKSFSFLISSASFQSSFVEQRIQAAATDPKIKVVSAVGYKIKPKGTYSEKKFVVFVGKDTVDPEIINSVEELSVVLTRIKSKWSADMSKSLESNMAMMDPNLKVEFEEVPVDFEKFYRQNIHKSLMNHSGRYTARTGKLFQSKSLLLSAYLDGLTHPFTKESIVLSSGDKVQLQDYFLSSECFDVFKPHAIHIDQSISGDSTGISCVRYDGISKDELGVSRRHYTQVFTLEIIPPPPPHQIKISKVRDFIVYLDRVIGMNIVKVTTDQYQSTDNRQVLKHDFGIETEHQSIDKSDACYLAWMSILMDGGLSMYRYPLLEKETFDAIHDRARKKVDHPKGSTIDVLQSLVGALYTLVQMDLDATQYDDLPMPDRQINKKQEALNTFNRPNYTEDVFKQISDTHKHNNFIDSIIED